MLKHLWERLYVALGILAATLLIGTFGYTLIEGWNPFDALYMTVITVATVGFGEIHPLHASGRVFTIFLILGGLGAVGYAFSSVTAFIVEGELTDVLRRRRMLKKIATLKDHYIVCGGGGIGRTIMEELSKTRRPFVSIERNPEKAAHIESKGWLVIKGDSLDDETLRSAGIERAYGLFCALTGDRDNSFAAISARGLNPNLRIVSQLHDESVREKLLRSGADTTVSSGHIGGLRMASEMIRPAAVGFMDSMIRERGTAYRFEDVPLPPDSKMTGRALGEIKTQPGETALILAVRSGPGYEVNPPPERLLKAGESLVVLGDVEQVRRLKEMIAA
ncbi:MAG: potassium channel protein [Elusimicrobia bacterium]|nr:potassium channel protein [Elusimicrobiota bacterium]